MGCAPSSPELPMEMTPPSEPIKAFENGPGVRAAKTSVRLETEGSLKRLSAEYQITDATTDELLAKFEGKAFSLRGKQTMMNPDGTEICTIERRLVQPQTHLYVGERRAVTIERTESLRGAQHKVWVWNDDSLNRKSDTKLERPPDFLVQEIGLVTLKKKYSFFIDAEAKAKNTPFAHAAQQ